MILFPLILVMSFGLLVMLAGISVLAHFKNRDMSKFHKILSYTTTAFGSLIVFACLVGFTLVCFHGGSHCGKGNFRTEVCYGNQHGGSHHGSCSDNSCGDNKSCKMRKKVSCEAEGSMMEKEVIVKVIEDETEGTEK